MPILILQVQISQLAISMLLQRLQHPDASVEAAIAFNLVDLALPASPEVFSDIVKSFSRMSMTSLSSGTYTGRRNAVKHSLHIPPCGVSPYVAVRYWPRKLDSPKN